MRVFYRLGELSRVFGVGDPSGSRDKWKKRTARLLRNKGVPIERIGRASIVYLSDLRDTWPKLYDSIQLQRVSEPCCDSCGRDLTCPSCSACDYGDQL